MRPGLRRLMECFGGRMYHRMYHPPSARPGRIPALSGTQRTPSSMHMAATQLHLCASSQSIYRSGTARHRTHREAANGRIQSWCESDVAAVLLLLLWCVCYDLCSKCTKIPVLNGKEGPGASVYYINGDTVRCGGGGWGWVLVCRRTAGFARRGQG